MSPAALPILVVTRGSTAFDNDDFMARWEKTVSQMLPRKDADDAIRTAKAQTRLMETWLAAEPDERQFFATLRMPRYTLDVCLQNYPKTD